MTEKLLTGTLSLNTTNVRRRSSETNKLRYEHSIRGSRGTSSSKNGKLIISKSKSSLLSSHVVLCHVNSSCANNINGTLKFVPCYEVGYPANLFPFFVLLTYLVFLSSSHV